MTPFAHLLARSFVASGATSDSDEFVRMVLRAMSGAHFFEVTEIAPLIDDIATAYIETINRGDSFLPTTFLPARRTWVEWRQESGSRIAVALHTGGQANETEDENGEWIHALLIARLKNGEGLTCADIGGLMRPTGRVFLNGN